MVRKAYCRFDRDAFVKWFEAILVSLGYTDIEAEVGARYAADAAAIENESHGGGKILSLHHVDWARSGACVPGAERKELAKFSSMELWDANGQFGPLTAYDAQRQASAIAEEQGVGFVAVRRATHWGSGAPYVLSEARNGMLAMNFCQGSIPIVVPTGGVEKRAGSNAISLAFETYHPTYPFFCWDTGLAKVPWGVVQKLLHSGGTLPPNSVLDADGNITIDPKMAAALLPAGSIGNALNLAIELLGASIGAGNPHYRSAPKDTIPEGESPHCVFFHVAVNLALFDSFMPGDLSRQEHISKMVDELVGANGSARLPGFTRSLARLRSEAQDGLLFSPEAVAVLAEYAVKCREPLPTYDQCEIEVPEVVKAEK